MNRITIFKNRRAVQIIPKPKKYVKNGLKVYLNISANEFSLPIATTDIQIGKCRYYLPDSEYHKYIVISKAEFN